MSNITITDTTLRDGSHSVRHQYSVEEIARIAGALDDAGIDIIEVGHGDGLTGSTCNYGFAKESDQHIIAVAASAVKRAKIAVLLLPGIGTVEDLEAAREAGAQVVRVATHVTEADIAAQHIRAARGMGLLTIGFLMMAHRASVKRVVEEAGKMAASGADILYLTDSAGSMMPDEVSRKVQAMRRQFDQPIGFHAHNNLGLAIGNSIAALEAGAAYIDGSLGGLGAGAGNTSTEMLIAVLNRLGYRHSGDLMRAMDATTKVLHPIVSAHGARLNNLQDPMMLGYADVYSSFLLHARRAAQRFGVDYRDIILELGRRGAVGGQEDWIVDIAQELAQTIV